MLDALLAAEELPEEYKDRCQVRKTKTAVFLTLSIIHSMTYSQTNKCFRTFYVMTVNAKERHGSIGCTINAAPAVLTTPV